jgi:hypothetical protein
LFFGILNEKFRKVVESLTDPRSPEGKDLHGGQNSIIIEELVQKKWKMKKWEETQILAPYWLRFELLFQCS